MNVQGDYFEALFARDCNGNKLPSFHGCFCYRIEAVNFYSLCNNLIEPSDCWPTLNQPTENPQYRSGK
jgi:hypothetical protein